MSYCSDAQCDDLEKCTEEQGMTVPTHHLLSVMDYTPFQIMQCAVQHFAFQAEICYDVLGLEITMCPPLCMQASDTLWFVSTVVIFTGGVDSSVCPQILIMSINGIYRHTNLQTCQVQYAIS